MGPRSFYLAGELAEYAGTSERAVQQMCKRTWSRQSPPTATQEGKIWLIAKETGDSYIRSQGRTPPDEL